MQLFVARLYTDPGINMELFRRSNGIETKKIISIAVKELRRTLDASLTNAGQYGESHLGNHRDILVALGSLASRSKHSMATPRAVAEC